MENYSASEVQLVIGDVPDIPFGAHSPGFAECHVKQYFLSQCICACKVYSTLCVKFRNENTGCLDFAFECADLPPDPLDPKHTHTYIPSDIETRRYVHLQSV